MDNDLIGKDIRDITDDMHGQIVAKDIRGRWIMAFDDSDEVFIFDEDCPDFVFEKPEEVEEIIEHNGRKYKLVD